MTQEKFVEPVIMPVVPGSLSELDKARLSEIGVVVIEHADPSQVRLIRPGCEISAAGLVYAAMEAIRRSGSQHANQYLGEEIVRQSLTVSTKALRNKEQP